MSKLPEKKEKYKYPSRFGSEKSMQISEPDENGMVKCEDEYGVYQTPATRVGSGLADPARCAESRLGKLFAGRKKEEK